MEQKDLPPVVDDGGLDRLAGETDPATLPQWKGHAVPWVARWSAQTSPNAYGVKVVQKPDGYRLRIDYQDNNWRDQHGVLWQQEGLVRGGEPQFGMVSTWRQRAAMVRRLCQVCGNKIEGPLTPWILDLMETQMVEILDGFHLTATAPVCESCITLAQRLCPHLSTGGNKVYDVLEYEIWGVFGEVVTMAENGPKRFQANIGYREDYGEKFSLGAVLAKQQVVKLIKFKERA